MEKLITILGALLITMIILISSSAAAGWLDSVYSSSGTCTSLPDILGAPDNSYATIGEDPSTLGWAILDLGSGDEMPSSTNFVVYAQTPVEEDYAVWVGETSDVQYMHYVGQGTDDTNETFTTPSSPPTASWRYILIVGVTGVGLGTGDYAYGPDIDAVGW